MCIRDRGSAQANVKNADGKIVTIGQNGKYGKLVGVYDLDLETGKVEYRHIKVTSAYDEAAKQDVYKRQHLAFASVVHERRVEVGEATRHIFVHHLGGKLVVNRLLVVGVEKGKTHHSQAEFSHFADYFLRKNLMNAQPPIT